MTSIWVNGAPQRKVLVGTIYGLSYWGVWGNICVFGHSHELYVQYIMDIVIMDIVIYWI